MAVDRNLLAAEEHRAGDVARLVEVHSFDERDDSSRMRVRLHRCLERQRQLELPARIRIADGIATEWFEHPDVHAVGPLEVRACHAPGEAAAAGLSIRPGREAPMDRPRRRPTPRPRRCRGRRSDGPGNRSSLRDCAREHSRRTSWSPSPTPVGHLLVVEVVVLRPEGPVGALGAAAVEIDLEHLGHGVITLSSGQCRSASAPMDGRASSVSRAIRRHKLRR